jgi:hypothetical protein
MNLEFWHGQREGRGIDVHALELLAAGQSVMLCQTELDRPEIQKYGRADRL